MERYRTPWQIEKEDGIDVASLVGDRRSEGTPFRKIAMDLGVREGSLARFMYVRRRQTAKNQDRVSLQAAAEEKFSEPLESLLHRWAKVEKISGNEMSDRLGCEPSAVHYWLKKLGLSTDIGEGRKRAHKTGRLDYNGIFRQIRHTQLNQPTEGSLVAEQVLRALRAGVNDNPFPGFDVILGSQQWSIIPPKEVDIALVLVHKGAEWGRTAYTFAIEVDGTHYHDNPERDALKDAELRDAGWIPLRIPIHNDTREKQIKDAVDELLVRIRKKALDCVTG